jgi:type II secretory pathway component GspD/PulD (secretin)
MQGGLCQICVGSRLVSARWDIASTVGVSWRYLEAFSADREEELPSQSTTGMPVVRADAAVDDYLPVAVAVLDERQAHSFLNAAQADVRANTMQAPKVTFINGQEATLFNGTQRPFVVGIESARSGAERAKIAVIDEGLKLTLRASQLAKSKKTRLQGRVELSEIGDVRAVSTEHLSQLRTIQIPRARRCRVDVSSELQEGQSVLIGIIPSYERKRFLYVLLTVHLVLNPAGT